MNYPKQVMRISEMMKLGFPKEMLLNAYQSPGQTFAFKLSRAVNSPILFDTEKFDAWLTKEIQLEQTERDRQKRRCAR